METHNTNWIGGFMFILLNYAAIVVLVIIIPAPIMKGYAKTLNNESLLYKVNGLRAFLCYFLIYSCLIYTDCITPTYLYDHYYECILAGFIYGLALSIVFYVWGPFPEHVTAPKRLSSKSGGFEDFFLGVELNPRFAGSLFDIKLCCYLIGAITVELVVISSLFKHYQIFGSISLPIVVYAFEMSCFLLDYVYHEHVHLFTYDFIDENVGFKILWGCLCVFSFFYPIGILPLVTFQPPLPHSTTTIAGLSIITTNTTIITSICSIILYIVGIFLSRVSNLQKFYFKLNPKKSFCGIKPDTIADKILVSGLWGLARHINYLGEILQAIALSLPGGLHSFIPWLYPLFYVMILIPRERDDNKRCAEKYGKQWLLYEKKVPYKIIPYLY